MPPHLHASWLPCAPPDPALCYPSTSPRCLAEGGVYVLDGNNTQGGARRAAIKRGLLQSTPKPTMRIQKFDGPSGTLLVAFGSYGTGPGQMANPYGITTTRNGFWVRGS